MARSTPRIFFRRSAHVTGNGTNPPETALRISVSGINPAPTMNRKEQNTSTRPGAAEGSRLHLKCDLAPTVSHRDALALCMNAWTDSFHARWFGNPSKL